METIIAALISGGLALVGVVISNNYTSQKMLSELQMTQVAADAKLEKAQAVTDAKIEELTREVREHNNFARRMPVVEEQIKVANHRIEDLEGYHKPT